MRNPFEAHGIGWLSPTTVGYMYDDLAYALIATVPELKVKSRPSPAAFRGRALDQAITLAVMHDADFATDERVMEHAVRVFRDEADKELGDGTAARWLDEPPTDLMTLRAAAEEAEQDAAEAEAKGYGHEAVTAALALAEQRREAVARAEEAEQARREVEDLIKYLTVALPHLRRWGRPEAAQGKVEVFLEGIEVPLIGYYDLKYPDRVRDLKTTQRMPSKVSPRHGRQLSIYMAATQLPPWVDYVTPRELRSLKVPEPEYRLREVAAKVRAFRALLASSSDIREVCALVAPDYECFLWDDTARARAKEIWGF